MEKKFIMVMQRNTPLNPYIYKDLYEDDRVDFLRSVMKEIKNRILLFIQRIHLSRRINRAVSLPFKSIWGFSLDNYRWEENIEYYIIFPKLFPLTPKYLNELRSKHNIKYVLSLHDPIDDPIFSSHEKYCMNAMIFDYIFTIDPSDAEKYHFIYEDSHYSVISNSSPKLEYDLYFIGQNKNRLNILIDLYSRIEKNNITSKYRITGVKKNEQQYSNRILFNQRIPYPEVVEEAKKSNCILEVLCDLQTGATLRYYEAICYNKKLLTNNKNVVNLPFYNSEYIHVFEKPEDIDWNWVKERIPVDYHYDGRFSPTHLIDRIIELEEQKEAQAGEEKK